MCNQIFTTEETHAKTLKKMVTYSKKLHGNNTGSPEIVRDIFQAFSSPFKAYFQNFQGHNLLKKRIRCREK